MFSFAVRELSWLVDEDVVVTVVMFSILLLWLLLLLLLLSLMLLLLWLTLLMLIADPMGSSSIMDSSAPSPSNTSKLGEKEVRVGSGFGNEVGGKICE